MAKTRPSRPERIALDELRGQFGRLQQILPGMAPRAAQKAVLELLKIAGEIEQLRQDVDPIKDPGEAFNPSDPDTAGRLVTLALLCQERLPLGRVAGTYGSGVYAIYYNGPHPAYAPVSGTETPVYVGKADPSSAAARTPREQGPRLSVRLSDHRRMIRAVGEYARAHELPDPLDLADFECRRLVCATNAQLVAERHLINMFQPVWNSDVKIAFGISKHGDDAEMRKNGRSPWDVLHPGRAWAMRLQRDQVPKDSILQNLADHFQRLPPMRTRDDVLNRILTAFIQNAPLAAPEDVAMTDELIEPQARLDFEV